MVSNGTVRASSAATTSVIFEVELQTEMALSIARRSPITRVEQMFVTSVDFSAFIIISGPIPDGSPMLMAMIGLAGIFNPYLLCLAEKIGQFVKLYSAITSC